MKSSLLLLFSVICVLFAGCGDGSTSNTSQNYYSASSTSYYQIVSNESGSDSTYTLNIVANSGNLVSNLPLTQTSNGYTFSGTVDGVQSTGTIVLHNDQMGFALNSANSNYADFATTNTNTNAIPDGTYTTVCDQNNISACTMKISNSQITVTEYSISGTPTVLCTSQALIQAASGAINPYTYSFSCGVHGGASTGTWYIMPLAVKNVTAIMVSEYDPSINSNDNQTDEVAFPQASFTPNGSYNYLYTGITSGQSGISTATINNNTIINATVGSCSGAACALIQGQYAGTVGMPGNPMTGFDYYSVGGTVNYNFVGSTAMNIFMDSYSGIYF